MLDKGKKVWYILTQKERYNLCEVTGKKEGRKEERKSKDAISITNPNYNYNSFDICVAYCDSNKETTYAKSAPLPSPPLRHPELLQTLYKRNQAIMLAVAACYLTSTFLVLLLILHAHHAN